MTAWNAQVRMRTPFPCQTAKLSQYELHANIRRCVRTRFAW